jgi:ribosomal protein L14
MYKESFIKLADNTGISYVKCIHSLGGASKRKAEVGSFVVVIIPQRRKQRKLLLKNMYIGLIIAQKKEKKRLNGIYIRMAENKVILLTDLGKLLGLVITGNINEKVLYYECFSGYSLYRSSQFI